MRLPSGFHRSTSTPVCASTACEVWNRPVEPVKQAVHSHRRTGEIGHLAIQRLVNLGRRALVKTAQERVGMHDLDPERLAGGRGEVAKVQRDDRLGLSRGNRSGEHVTIARFVSHLALVRGNLGRSDLGIGKCSCHRIEQVRGLLDGCPPIVDEIPGDLVEYPAAPSNCAQVLPGDPE
ncbi:MAG: hypothetical protein ACRDMX_14345 [Solirubrobacteraceae bacterium]